MSSALWLGDCVEIMAALPDESIDLTVTSPPYDALREYGGFSRFDFEGAANALYRVTKPYGVVVWIVNDATYKGSETGTSFRQALYFMGLGFKLHDTMIWAKPNPVPTQSTRYQQATEYMFVFSKLAPGTTNLLREPAKYAGCSKRRHRARGDAHTYGEGHYVTGPDKIRSNWWSIPAGGPRSRGHPAEFPLQLAVNHILSWSNPGEVVLDPFMGSGTTGEAALTNGRKFIGVEINADYFDIARARLAPLGVL